MRTSLDALAAATGHGARALSYALPELRPQYPDPGDLRLAGRTLARPPASTRPACRLCMAAKGIRAPVTTWVRHDHNACLAHQLWIGPGADTPGRQAAISGLPEIARLAAFHLVLYPEAVALAAVFAMPRWLHLALSPDRADNHHRFHDELSARVLQATRTRAQPGGDPDGPLVQRITSLRAELRLRAGIEDPNDPTMTWRLRPRHPPPGNP